MNSNKTARQQYVETYRRLRTQNRAAGLTIEEMKSDLRKAAYAATQSMFALKHSHDQIETYQIRLNNAKSRLAIRKQNARIMTTNIYTTKHGIQIVTGKNAQI